MLLIRPLDDILSSQAKVAALRVLANSPVGLTGREIARRAGIAHGHISRVLRELTGAGIIAEQHVGRSCLYSYDDRSALSRQLKQLFVHEDRRFRDVVRQLAKDTPGLQSIMLFGSEARGAAGAKSDTDVLLVVDKATEALKRKIRRRCLHLTDLHQLYVSCLTVDLAQVGRWQRENHPFWTNVVRDGVLLWGKDLRGATRGDVAGIPPASAVVLGSG